MCICSCVCFTPRLIVYVCLVTVRPQLIVCVCVFQPQPELFHSQRCSTDPPTQWVHKEVCQEDPWRYALWLLLPAYPCLYICLFLCCFHLLHPCGEGFISPLSWKTILFLVIFPPSNFSVDMRFALQCLSPHEDSCWVDLIVLKANLVLRHQELVFFLWAVNYRKIRNLDFCCQRL